MLNDHISILDKAIKLMEYHKSGKLGGSFMPEDRNPDYPRESKERYMYFTLPMALNYQRDSYKLWESAHTSAKDIETFSIFEPEKVILMSEEELQNKLVKHKVALQKNKQPVIWRRLCQTFNDHFDNDVRELFKQNNNNVIQIKEYMLKNKKDFPYLSGNKIMNYWLYVMSQYTDLELKDRCNISVAPDTNVIQASLKLKIINENELRSTKVQQIVSERWVEILKDTDYEPIDIHTPLWLWNRGHFPYSDSFFSSKD